MLGEKVTNTLSALLNVASNDTLSPADLDVLTGAVTNQLAERAEDLQCVEMCIVAYRPTGVAANAICIADS